MVVWAVHSRQIVGISSLVERVGMAIASFGTLVFFPAENGLTMVPFVLKLFGRCLPPDRDDGAVREHVDFGVICHVIVQKGMLSVSQTAADCLGQ